MENLKSNLSSIIDHAKEYADARIELAKLEILDEVSAGVASLTSMILISIAGAFALLFASAAVAWAIGTRYGLLAGLLSVAGGYLVIAILVYALRKNLIQTSIINTMLKHFSDGE